MADIDRVTTHADSSWTRRKFVDRNRSDASSSANAKNQKEQPSNCVFRIARVSECQMYWEDTIHHQRSAETTDSRIMLVHPFTTTAKIVIARHSKASPLEFSPDKINCDIDLETIRIDWHERQHRHMLSSLMAECT